MISQIVWLMGADKSITKVTKKTNKLFANGQASAQYCLLSDYININDVVTLTITRDNDKTQYRLVYQNINLKDGTTKKGWAVVSNGNELNFDLQTDTASLTFAFEVKQYSTPSGDLIASYTTQSDVVTVYPSSAYFPQVEATDADKIFQDLAEKDAQIVDLQDNKQDKVDNGLQTTSKSVVGAINETLSLAKNNENRIDQNDSNIADIEESLKECIKYNTFPAYVCKIKIDMSKSPSLNGLFTLNNGLGVELVNWGDGSITEKTSNQFLKHQYSNTSFNGEIVVFTDKNGYDAWLSSSIENIDAVKSTYIAIEFDNVGTIRDIQGYENLETVIVPSNYKQIGGDRFRNCRSLKYIYIPNSVTEIVTPFQGCDSLKNLYIPDSVVSIGDAVFSSSNIETVRLSKNVTSIAHSLFSDCKNLHNIDIPEKVTLIGSRAFEYTSLKKIIIPNNVSSIGSRAFDKCQELETVIIKSDIVPTISSDTFPSTINTIYVKKELLQQYKQLPELSSFANRIYADGGDYSETITIPRTSWSSSAKTVTVTAIGSTNEDRNIVIPSIASQYDDYGIRCISQDNMTLTFKCDEIPAEDVTISVAYVLTNK